MLELNGTIIAVILNFIILVWVLNYFLYKPLQNMLFERKKIIESNIQDAEAKSEKANVLKAQYESRLVSAQNEAQNIVKNAVISSEKIKYAAFEAAKKDTEFMRLQAIKEAQEIKIEACGAAKKDLASLICSAAGRLIKKNLDEKANKGLIDDMIENLDKVNLADGGVKLN